MTYITTGARRVETFAGMFAHQASGLYLTMYRAYDPYSARWLSRDPNGELGPERNLMEPDDVTMRWRKADATLSSQLSRNTGVSSLLNALNEILPERQAFFLTISVHGFIEYNLYNYVGADPIDWNDPTGLIMAPLNCAGPNSSCAVGANKFNSDTPGMYTDPDDPAFLLCYDCFKKSQGVPPDPEEDCPD